MDRIAIGAAVGALASIFYHQSNQKENEHEKIIEKYQSDIQMRADTIQQLESEKRQIAGDLSQAHANLQAKQQVCDMLKMVGAQFERRERQLEEEKLTYVEERCLLADKASMLDATIRGETETCQCLSSFIQTLTEEKECLLEKISRLETAEKQRENEVNLSVKAIRKTEDQMRTITHENCRLKSEILSSKAEIRQQEQKIICLQSESFKQKQHIVAQADEISNRLMEIATKQNEIELLMEENQKFSEVKVSLSKLNTENQFLSERISALEKVNKHFRYENQKLQSSLEELRYAEYSERRLAPKISEILYQRDKAMQEREHFRTELFEITQKLQQRSEENHTAYKQVTELKATNKSMSATLSDLTIRTNRLTEELRIEKSQNYSHQLSDLKTAINNLLQSSVKDTEDRIAAITKSSSASYSLQDELRVCRRTLSTITEENRELTRKISELQRSINYQYSTISELKAELKTQKSAFAMISSREVETQRKLVESNRRVEILLRENTEEERQSWPDNSLLEAKLAESFESTEKLKSELEAKANMCDKLSKECQEKITQQKSLVAEQRVLEEKLISANNAATCCVCLTNVKNVVFWPCKHVCACMTCSGRIIKCPICRSQVNQKYQIFTS